MQDRKLPISAMIVGYNEAHFLPSCLESINFCDEIVYTDLGSTDNSIAIAESYSCKINYSEKVPSCEHIQADVVHTLKNDWVIFIDPDERIDTILKDQILEEFESLSLSSTIGAVIVPWVFYFKNHLLKGTIWGGINKKFLLVHKNRFDFLPIVHYGRKLKDEYTTFEIELNATSNNIMHHYWMNSTSVFLAKHRRYLLNEGKDHYNMGYRCSLKKILLTPFKEFTYSFIQKKGYKDGIIGLKLSIFWAWYRTHIAKNIWQMGEIKT